jgi:hypothetical protein
MKKLLLHIILISYAALLFKPVMPFVNDFIDHVFFYAKHLATVHEENGRRHVHLETAKNASEENNKEGNTPASSKKDNTVVEHYFFVVNAEPVVGKSLNLHLILRNNDAICNSNIQKNYPPPRC